MFAFAIPLTVLPLIAYGVLTLNASAAPWGALLLEVGMISGATWQVTMGDAMVAFGLGMLFIEVIKATRTGNGALIDHLLSTMVLIAYLVLFIVWSPAATSTFVLLGLMALVDVLAGFSVALRGARRDVAIGSHNGY